MIVIVWSNHDGTAVETFGEGLDAINKAEEKLLELMNLERSDDSYGTTIHIVLRGAEEVRYEVTEVASKVKIRGKNES